MSIITLYKISTSDKSSYNWNDIYFQNGNKLNFHVRYAKKINFGTSHNIKFQKNYFIDIKSSERVIHNQWFCYQGFYKNE